MSLSLNTRGRSVEEAWAKDQMEQQAAAHFERLRKSTGGQARLAVASTAVPGSGILPSIAAQYVRLGPPPQTEYNIVKTVPSFKTLNHRLAGVCTGNPLFISDLRVGSMRHSGSKWAASTGTVEGVSLFDVRGAVELAKGTKDNLPVQRALPVAAPTEGVLQLGRMSLRLMPDFTPSRALVWGTVLACWAVGGVTVKAAKSMGISSVEDVRDKVGATMLPAAAACRGYMTRFVSPPGAGGNVAAQDLAGRLRMAMR